MATNQDLIDYYKDLLILQYRGKNNARSQLDAFIKEVIANQISLSVQNAFDINTAVGDQLDVIGKYVGVERSVYTFTQAITLDDNDFRTFIKVAVLKNSAGSSLYDIQSLLNQFFEDTLFVFDFKTMSLSYFFDASIGSRPLAEVFVRSGFLPKPMGVQLTAVIYAANIANLYGFRTYETAGFNVTGFNDYTDYDESAPWLNYGDAIIS